ncbi:MAG: AAA family ATPase [Clostridiales bacterium]|nr:AAA family ATPase [Clostridiales bacterium]
MIEKQKRQLDDDNKELDKILSAVAKSIKGQFQVIATTDSYYSNYNKTKVEKFIKDNIQMLEDGGFVLSNEELEQNNQAATPYKKDNIAKLNISINVEQIVKKEKEFEVIISTTVSAKVIEELRGNPELSVWVEKGLVINKDRKKCAFCGGLIKKDRIEELENHYSDAMQNLKKQIVEYIEFLLELEENIKFNMMELDKFYPEYIDEARVIQSNITAQLNEIEKYINLMNDKLNEKKENPFANVIVKKCKLAEQVELLQNSVEKLNLIVDSHNRKNEQFDNVIKNAKSKLEGHYISEQLVELDYFEKRRKSIKQREMLLENQEKLNNKLKRIENLEAMLSNETLGAERFNAKLEQFLGYGDIKLEFDQVKKGYKIVRNGIQEARNLSEGEKTSIAFLYFITKLHENGKDIKNRILVIDDPISSFDSNKIFHAYAFLKKECRDVRQLFVLTHNYNYYSLILGWFKQEKIKIDGNKKPNYEIYRIEVDIDDGMRNGYIRSAGAGLTQSSEYDYVFYNVYKFKDKILNKEEIIFVGNIARKLVESFLSFKFPAQRGDLKSLLTRAFPDKDDEIEREEIYRFINVYSHHKYIDVSEQLDMDILDASSSNIINKILDMIYRLDTEHYNAMKKRAEDELDRNI